MTFKKAMLGMSIAFFLNQECVAQTFSYRSSENILTLYLGVLNQPFGYQTIGINIDTSGGYTFDARIVNFDFYGSFLDTKSYVFESKEYEPRSSINARLNDSTTVFIVLDFESGIDTVFNTVVWMNNVGDTLETKRYKSPFHVDDEGSTFHFVPTAICIDNTGEYIYFVSQVAQGDPAQNNFLIKKLTAQGDEVWTYENPLDNSYQYCSAIQFYNDNLWYVIAGWGNNAYNKLVQMDESNHVVLQQIELIPGDYIVSYAEEMSLDEDGAVVACIEWNGSSVFKPSVYKMDYDGNLLWDSTPVGVAAVNQQNVHLAKSPDGGYVSCSVKYDEQINPEDPNDPSSNNTSEKIWLWKVDSEGVFQWQRFYEYLSFDSGYFYLNNIAHDMKATPDGGYIMAGEATASCLQWPECDDFTQQGWLLKVDGCGCLVPGCDEACTVDINEDGRHPELDSGSLFLVGPNPASDMLNIYLNKISNIQLSTLNIQVHNLAGKLVRSFDLKHDDTTYMIDTTSLAAGQYVVSLVSGNVVLQTEQVVIAK